MGAVRKYDWDFLDKIKQAISNDIYLMILYLHAQWFYFLNIIVSLFYSKLKYTTKIQLKYASDNSYVNFEHEF